MARIDFYILNQEDFKSKLHFTCKIIQKIHDLNLKVLVRTPDSAKSEIMDRLLWTFRQNSFIPHTIFSTDGVLWTDYPIQISHEHHCPDEANVLINLQEETDEEYLKYERIVELVGNNQEDKINARKRYRYYRDQGIEPHSHQV